MVTVTARQAIDTGISLPGGLLDVTMDPVKNEVTNVAFK